MENGDPSQPSTPPRSLDVDIEGLDRPLIEDSPTDTTASPAPSVSPPPPPHLPRRTSRKGPNLSLEMPQQQLIEMTRLELRQTLSPTSLRQTLRDPRRGVVVFPPGSKDAVCCVPDVEAYEIPCPGCIRIGTNGMLDRPPPASSVDMMTPASDSTSSPMMEHQSSFQNSPLHRADSQVSSKSIALDSSSSMGRGAQGKVVPARDKNNYWTAYAVKWIPLKENVGMHDERRLYSLKSIQRELQLFRLNMEHPGARHIVRLKDAYIDEAPPGGQYGGQDAVFIIMEAATCNLADVMKTLKDKLKTREQLNQSWKSFDNKFESDKSTSWIPEPVLANIAAQVMHALKLLQSQDGEVLVHNDVKPENILYKDGRLMLADLGCCQWVRGDTVQETPLGNLGDERYRAPERMGECAKFDESADLWSLALVLLELSLGQHPCREYMRYEVPDYDSEHMMRPERLSDEFDDFLRSCLALDPSQRVTLDEAMRKPFVSQYFEVDAVTQDLINSFGRWYRVSQCTTPGIARACSYPSQSDLGTETEIIEGDDKEWEEEEEERLSPNSPKDEYPEPPQHREKQDRKRTKSLRKTR